MTRRSSPSSSDAARRRARQRAGAEGDVLALRVQAEARALAREPGGVDRAQQDGEHEGVAQLLLLARELELDLAVGGADDLHHRIAPQPQRLREGEHARDVDAALARQLAEARPDRRDRDAVGVQDTVDAQALLGALASHRGRALELGCGRRAQLGQRRQRPADVAAHRPRQRRGRQPAEVGKLVADAGDDAVDQLVDARLDLEHQPTDGGVRRRTANRRRRRGHARDATPSRCARGPSA